MKTRWLKPLSVWAAGAVLGVSAWAATPRDTLVVAKNIEDIVSLDPAEAFEFSGGEALANIYERLVSHNDKDPGALLPGLASEWKADAQDKTITFTLRPGAVFDGGNPVRPEDVIFSFKRVLKLNKSPASILSQLGWTNDNLEQMVQKTGPNTVSVAWRGEFGATYVLNVLASRPANIVDEKRAMANEKNGDWGNQWLKTRSAGSGPYTLKLYKPKEVLLLEANAQAAVAPKIPKVLIKNVTEPATQRLLIASGDADIVRDLGSDQIEAIKARTDVRVETVPSAVVHFLALNQKSEKLRNPAVWEAVRYLIDYEGISSQLLKGKMRIHQGFLPVGFAGALTTTPYTLDVERAKAILDKAGVRNLEIELDIINTPMFMDMAQSVQASMAKAGIKVTLQPGTGAQVITRYRARKHEAILLYWAPDFLDPHSNAKAFSYNVNNSDDAYQSTTTWRNSWLVPALSAKTMAALKESNPAKRVAMYTELQQAVQTQSPIVMTFQEQTQVALRANVKGYQQGATPDRVRYDTTTK